MFWPNFQEVPSCLQSTLPALLDCCTHPFPPSQHSLMFRPPSSSSSISPRSLRASSEPVPISQHLPGIPYPPSQAGGSRPTSLCPNWEGERGTSEKSQLLKAGAEEMPGKRRPLQADIGGGLHPNVRLQDPRNNPGICPLPHWRRSKGWRCLRES